MGPQGAVLIKGGHGDGARARDYLLTADGETWLEAERIATDNTHGTGCSLSSAIAANLARGMPMVEAVTSAKHWLTGAISAADDLSIGHGHGPVHHFYRFWKE
jgi:hydroxymethylpyrimidine/phosphomethylpyrimidine kinase